MKKHIDEVLLLGGLYVMLGTPLEYLHRYHVVDSLSKALMFAFIFIFLMLCFNHVPRILTFVRTEYPKASYYLRTIGWIPYALITVILIWDIFHALFHFPPHVIDGTISILRIIFPIILSLLLIKAFMDKKRTK